MLHLSFEQARNPNNLSANRSAELARFRDRGIGYLGLLKELALLRTPVALGPFVAGILASGATAGAPGATDQTP